MKILFVHKLHVTRGSTERNDERCVGLTVVEFIAIKRNLENISDTWSDLWAMLYLSQAKPGQLLGAKFDDVSHDILVLSATKD